ncbi:S41 family peptidase [Candidatus Ferrigenium straubiae]|uniref:S41 family peptidase n=1 Tax=Candidatus Ferrigenium straubiae TaxID=2919506 RepID=UPI003F4A9C8D
MNKLFGTPALLLTVLLSMSYTALATEKGRNLSVKQVNVAASEQRIALVIGNSAYRSGALRNPVNDAKDVAAKLRKQGFTVIERNNLQTRQIGRMLSEFRSRLAPGAVALVFYAGHGLQIKGENYLPAVDAEIGAEEDVPNQSLSVRQIMDVLDTAKTRLNLVFLDACRNNPYSRSFRSAAGDGLARISAPSGTLISYATRPGSVAADGDGRNGLYTSKLLKQMDSPLQIELALKRVVTEVKNASQGRQEPWMEGSIEGDFCFAGCDAGGAAQLAMHKIEAPLGREQETGQQGSVAGGAPGSVGVVSRAAGTEVWVDDNKIGETRASGEMLVSNLDSGRHRVLARKDSRIWEQTIEVSPGSKTTVAIAIEPSMPGMGAALLSEVVASVDKNYVTQPDLGRFLLGALHGIEKTVPSGTVSISQTNDGAALAYVAPNNAPTRVVLASPKTLGDLQKEIIFSASLAREIVPGLDQTKLEEAMLGAGLANLDPHSDFLNSEQFQELKTASSGTFGGIGIEVGIKEDELTVVTPIEGAPAERAGIQTRDRIVAINGADTKGTKLADVVRQMRGFPATQVTLSVMREGWTSPRDFVITREIIRLQSVRSRDIEPGISYISIRQFQQGTPDALQAVLDKWQGGSLGVIALRGIILDLRNNSGGLLNAVVEVAGKFLDDGRLVVTTEGRSPGSQMRLTASGKKRYVDIPMVVLVNEGSAAGAEILAGALQDSNRAIVVGNRTFGKGSIQAIIALSGGAAVKLSTAVYRTPSGRIIDGQGIEPNVLVPMPSSDAADPAKDIQLQRALAQLRVVMEKR